VAQDGGAMSAPARHWSQVGEGGAVAGLWAMYALYRVGGRLPLRVVLYPVVAAYWLAYPAARRASLEYLSNLQRATGALGHAPGWRETLRHFHSFAETILDKLLAVGGRYRFDTLRFVGRAALEAQLRSGRGALLVTAHVGCLEMCQALADAPHLKLTVLVHTLHAERFNRVLERLSPARAVRLLQVTELTPATAVLLSQRIEAGEFVAIAGDRVPLRAGRVNCVSVPFLGRPAPFPTGAYMMAALLKCPLVMMGCIRQGDVHEIVFERLADEVRLPRADRLGACAAYAGDFARRLERLLARAPYEWFNFYSFWDQPDGAAAPATHD
jgi:predicted LPLAT superfamily acyltransferase